MEDKIKNIQKMLKRSPQKGLVLLREYLQNDFKQISASERKKLYNKIKELEKIAYTAWQEMYSPESKGSSPALQEVSNQVAEGARKIFDKSGLKYDPIKVMNRALEMIVEGNNEKATALILTTCRTATHRAETIVRTIQIGKNRATAFDKAVKSGVEKFKYVGASAGIRPFCASNLNKVFTLEEIEKMNNGQGLSVRFSCGGYNCRHRWMAVMEGTTLKEQLAELKNKEILWDKKDLKSDTRKHMKDFGYADTKRYENDAIEIVKKQLNPHTNYHKGIQQFMFVGNDSYVVCTKQGKIKGYYYAGDIIKNIEKLREVKKCEPI